MGVALLSGSTGLSRLSTRSSLLGALLLAFGSLLGLMFGFVRFDRRLSVSFAAYLNVGQRFGLVRASSRLTRWRSVLLILDAIISK